MHPLISDIHDIKHAIVPKADILNTRGKLICVIIIIIIIIITHFYSAVRS